MDATRGKGLLEKDFQKNKKVDKVRENIQVKLYSAYNLAEKGTLLQRLSVN